jgi:hypothetical protein
MEFTSTLVVCTELKLGEKIQKELIFNSVNGVLCDWKENGWLTCLKEMDCSGIKVLAFRYRPHRDCLSKDSIQKMVAKSGHALARFLRAKEGSVALVRIVLVEF